MAIDTSRPLGSAGSKDPARWPTRKRTTYGWIVTGMLLLLMMISWADKAILGIVAVPLMKDLGITPAEFGLLGSAVFMFFGIAQFVAAPIANKVKAKWILLVLCLVWSVAQVPIFVFASLPALWFSRLLLGAGEGPLAPIIMHSVYKWFPARRSATPAALASSGVTLGIVAFAPVLAWINSEFGWKSTFIFLGALGVAWSVLWLLIGKEGPFTSVQVEREIEGKAEIVENSSMLATDTKVRYLSSFLTPSWLLAVLCSFLAYWTFTVATTWLPAYYETVLGAGTQAAGSLIALPAIWGAVATVGLSWFTQYLGNRGIATRWSRGAVLGAAATFSGAMVIAGTLTTVPAMITICFMFGFGTAPALFAVTYLVAAETTSVGQRGAVLQITNAFLTAGGLFAPMVVGFLVGGAATPAAGYSQAFLLTGIMLAVAGVVSCLFINQQRDRRRLGLDVELNAS